MTLLVDNSVSHQEDQKVSVGNYPIDTPFLELDLSLVSRRFRAFTEALPDVAVHYAVKANPEPALLHKLAQLGASFDVASPVEVQLALQAGATSNQLIYSNPIKSRRDIKMAFEAGVRLFVADAMSELEKLCECAPGAQIVARLSTTGAGADYPLSGKFGASLAECRQLLRGCPERGLVAAGLSFHVGSQQRDPEAWAVPIKQAFQIFAEVTGPGVRPWLLDLGGGFPAGHGATVPDLATYGVSIQRALRETFGENQPYVLAEPGRGLVGDAGRLVTKVIGVADRNSRRWVYLDAGVFSGMIETLDEAIRYRVSTSAEGSELTPTALAGPTCDSGDILYQTIELPASLAEGDQVVFHSAGAYTAPYSTVGFNGFAPLRTIVTGV
jgi:ornithine decarboxylase